MLLLALSHPERVHHRLHDMDLLHGILVSLIEKQIALPDVVRIWEVVGMNAFTLANDEDKETLESARHLIRRYLDAREDLKKHRILRSERTLQGDYAEWLVARLLDLQLSESSVEKGLDAKETGRRRDEADLLPDVRRAGATDDGTQTWASDTTADTTQSATRTNVEQPPAKKSA
jgi:hypothetical protein